MTPAEYSTYLTTISSVLAEAYARIALIPLAEIEQQLERVDSLGPILDPSAWNRSKASGLLDLQRKLVAWARKIEPTYQECVQRARDVALREQA